MERIEIPSSVCSLEGVNTDKLLQRISHISKKKLTKNERHLLSNMRTIALHLKWERDKFGKVIEHIVKGIGMAPKFK